MDPPRAVAVAGASRRGLRLAAADEAGLPAQLAGGLVAAGALLEARRRRPASGPAPARRRRRSASRPPGRTSRGRRPARPRRARPAPTAGRHHAQRRAGQRRRPCPLGHLEGGAGVVARAGRLAQRQLGLGDAAGRLGQQRPRAELAGDLARRLELAQRGARLALASWQSPISIERLHSCSLSPPPAPARAPRPAAQRLVAPPEITLQRAQIQQRRDHRRDRFATRRRSSSAARKCSPAAASAPVGAAPDRGATASASARGRRPAARARRAPPGAARANAPARPSGTACARCRPAPPPRPASRPPPRTASGPARGGTAPGVLAQRAQQAADAPVRRAALGRQVQPPGQPQHLLEQAHRLARAAQASRHVAGRVERVHLGDGVVDLEQLDRRQIQRVRPVQQSAGRAPRPPP